ncbi:metal-sensing transcriptional repressor [Candidatus Gracilibacteria bacterium]|nr:metal-sensing transcriptional repressor [Candidatus Gracilibacteria bacterium]
MKKNQEKAIIAVKKARSTLDKIIDMMEKKKYCIDIVQQNLAVIGLLKSSNLSLLEDHLNCCFVDAARSGDKNKLDQMINEMTTVIKTAQNK